MGMDSASGGGSDGYVKSVGGGLNPWVGWGISTLLLFFLNRRNRASNTNNQQPSKYTADNVNCVGQPVPVVLGRCMIKNPLVSYYGDFGYKPYTEEYGLHSDVSFAPAIVGIILSIISAIIVPDNVVVATAAGPGSGYTTDAGIKRGAIVNAVANALIWILMRLLTDHLGRTTIQKGFLYYLGWQNIICWTGENIGIKKLWMNVYDSDIEESTETGVWDNDSHIAWEVDNMSGIEAYIDDKEMFGGWDEGGGFTGSVRFYFGNRFQPKDPWMINQMKQPTIEEDLRGLTPQYPMYLTCVITNKDMNGGAYIGKQATIPEMWFEVVNYPTRIADGFKPQVLQEFIKRLADAQKLPNDYINAQDPTVIRYMSSAMTNLNNKINEYIRLAELYIADPRPEIYPSNDILDEIYNLSQVAYETYPPTNREDFGMTLQDLNTLCEHKVWTLGRLGDDLNPAEAIYEILMNEYWGCDYREDRIDVDSLIQLGITCEIEQLGVSCLINRVSQANDYITKILNHINGVKFDNPTTGKLTFKLIRNDYDIDEIKVFDVSNCVSCEFSRLDWSETNSAVALTFTDADHKYDEAQFTYTDISNRLITGSYTEKTIEGTYFTTPSNAKWLAQMSLLSAGYPLSAVNLVTNRIAYDVTIGEPIKVSWEPYGIKQQVYRVTDVDYATLTDGKISITALEDVFGFDKIDYIYSGAPSWTDPSDDPIAVGRYLFMEMPYEMVKSLKSFIYAFAARPSSSTVIWNIWRYKQGSYTITSNSTGWSTVARMTYGYNVGYETDEIGFEVTSIGYEGSTLLDVKLMAINENPTAYNNRSGLNLLIVDNEIMSYDSIELLPSGHYQIKGVIRGVFDTIPKEHTAESIVYFYEQKLNVDGRGNAVCDEGNVVTEQLEITTESRTSAQPFSIDDVYTMSTRRRTESPSIMANLKYSADRGEKSSYNYDYLHTVVFSGNILFNFIPRNKFSAFGILEQTDNETEIVLPTDTKNVIQGLCNGYTFEFMYDATKEVTTPIGGIPITQIVNLDAMELKWADVCKELRDRVSDTNAVSLYIKTYDTTREIYSWDVYQKDITYNVPRMVGVVANQVDAQTLADSYIVDDDLISVTATTVSPVQSMTYNDCPLIFIGSPSTDPSGGILGQDGNKWILSTTAYRIVGNDSGTAILKEIEIEEYYIIRTNFTVLESNYPEYYQYDDLQYNIYTIYVV